MLPTSALRNKRNLTSGSTGCRQQASVECAPPTLPSATSACSPWAAGAAGGYAGPLQHAGSPGLGAKQHGGGWFWFQWWTQACADAQSWRQGPAQPDGHRAPSAGTRSTQAAVTLLPARRGRSGSEAEEVCACACTHAHTHAYRVPHTKQVLLCTKGLKAGTSQPALHANASIAGAGHVVMLCSLLLAYHTVCVHVAGCHLIHSLRIEGCVGQHSDL
eukprot:1152168-Pelagomonas_calceolata.AAC.8